MSLNVLPFYSLIWMQVIDVLHPGRANVSKVIFVNPSSSQLVVWNFCFFGSMDCFWNESHVSLY